MLSGSCHCGELQWTFKGNPHSATACNCTICRRYGALWVYGWDGDVISTSGPSRRYAHGSAIDFHFCPTCGCLAFYRVKSPDSQGRRKMAANARMIDNAAAVADLPIRHFDGLDSFKDLADDGRCVSDLWF